MREIFIEFEHPLLLVALGIMGGAVMRYISLMFPGMVSNLTVKQIKIRQSVLKFASSSLLILSAYILIVHREGLELILSAIAAIPVVAIGWCTLYRSEILLKKKYWGQHLWARGYFCCTVGSVTEEMIKDYVEHQEDKDGDDIFKITE